MSKYVLAAVDDLFFAAKIRAAAEEAGLEVGFGKSVEGVLERARSESPSLIIADLHSARCDPFALAQQLKEDEKLRDVPIIGFFSHVQTELQRRALESGFDRVWARSAFSKNLTEILKGAVT